MCKPKSGPPNCMSKTRLCLTSVLGTCQVSPVGDGAPLQRTLQIRCQNAKFRFRKRPCPRLCGKARNPSRCTARSCHVKAFNCPPDAQITPAGAQNDTQAPPHRTQRTTNQPTNPARIKVCRSSMGWPVTSPQASSIRPPHRCRVKTAVLQGLRVKD